VFLNILFGTDAFVGRALFTEGKKLNINKKVQF